MLGFPSSKVWEEPSMPRTALVRGIGSCAGVVNCGLLVFNAGFLHAEAISAPNPAMFSTFGQVMVLVWGFAFAAAGMTDASPAVWGAFALEKLCYVVGYVHWHSAEQGHWKHKWAEAISSFRISEAHDVTPLLAPIFHYIYGPIDAVFFLLFLYVACLPRRKDPRREMATAATELKGD